MKLRIALIGCVDSSEIVLRTLVGMPESVEVVALITRRGSNYNSDFVDLTSLAVKHSISLLYVEDGHDDLAQAEWLALHRPDLIFCVGWSRLLGPAIMNVSMNGVVGFHPAALPMNRGRHPIVWSLALGLDETASSFFLMDQGADSGPILSQQSVRITVDDDASSLYAKILNVMPKQIRYIVDGVAHGTLQPHQQDDTHANYWRKRGPEDGCIDWRMDAENIRNLVRALAKPYPGAHFFYDGKAVKLWRCTVVVGTPRNLEPGKILEVSARRLVVKCGREALLLTDHELEKMPTEVEYL